MSPLITASDSKFECNWCNKQYPRGSQVCTIYNKKFADKIHLLISQICFSHEIAIGVNLLIRSFISGEIVGPRPVLCVPVCIPCSKFNITFTRSGRASQQPIHFHNINFIKGSGEAACDQYDRGYDDGKFSNYGDYAGYRTLDDKNFIANEKEPVCEITYSDEEEFAFSSSDSDEDEEWSEDLSDNES